MTKFIYSLPFQMDIGMVWSEPNHAFVNKWLLLSDPEDSMAGAKGYLKFAAIVLGPGDTPPVRILSFISLLNLFINPSHSLINPPIGIISLGIDPV